MYSITQFGKPLDKSKYTIDEKTKTFSSNENSLVLDFSDKWDWVFGTASDCTFKTGYECVVVRRDIYEVIELDEGQKIKLNGWGVKGYTIENDKKQELLSKADELIQKANELREQAEDL